MTIDKAFKDVYSDLLEEYGYQYCAKLKRFVKVVNKELIFSFYLKKVPAMKKNNKAFTVMSGIVSTYFSDCTRAIFKYNEKEIKMYSPTRDYGMGFEYNEENMIGIMENSAEIVKNLIVPIFEKVIDLPSYVEYTKKYNVRVLIGCDKFVYDSLTLILTNDHDDFMWGMKYARDNEIDFAKRRIRELYSEPMNKVYNNPELMKAAYAEAERRKKEILEMLESYKINI